MAGPAERLKIVRIVGPSAFEGNDMVYLDCDDDTILLDAGATQRLSSQYGLADRHPGAAAHT